MKYLILSFCCLCYATFGFAQAPVLGVVLNDRENPFFNKILEGVYQSAANAGIDGSSIRVVDSQYDVQMQIQQLKQLQFEGVDAIILTAADPIVLQPHITALVQSGVLVIAVDVRAHGASATFNTHNAQAGRIACRYLAQLLNQRGKLAVINGPSVTAVVERVAGCEYELQEEFTSIQVVDSRLNGQGSIDGGYQVMQGLLQRHPDLDAVFAINDPSAIGADRLLEEAGRKDILIASVDGSPSAMVRMQQASSRIVATSTQNPRLMGVRAVEAIIQMREGEAVSRYNLIESELVTRENMATYSGW